MHYLFPYHRFTMRLCLALAVLASPAAWSDEVTLDLTRVDSGNLYLHGVLGGDVQADMLVDTGSSYVSVTRRTFKALEARGRVAFSRTLYGAMANGKVEKMPVYLLDEMQLSENCIIRRVEVAVMDGADQDILGMNALARLEPFTLSLTPVQIKAARCS